MTQITDIDERVTMNTISNSLSATIIALSILFSVQIPAQEDANPPAPPLQWPMPAGVNPRGGLSFLLLRAYIEESANASICKMFMQDEKMQIPEDFDYSKCPARLRADIESGRGKYSWADGARPTKCGISCIGGPSISQTQNVDRPNSIYALTYGHLRFHVDVPGPFNRDVDYDLEIDANCTIPAGSTAGVASVVVHANGPISEDPGWLESIADFLLQPLDISQQITDGIKRLYGGSTSSNGMGPCKSIGALSYPSTDYTSDAFVWDLPQPTRPRSATSMVTAFKPSVTIYFDRIFRNNTIQSNPSKGPLGFTVYINGLPVHIPPNSTISLPPNQSYDQKYCRTVTMDGVDRLQLIFVDSFGGAVWSQFTSAQHFGSDGPHRMTTERTLVTPGSHSGDRPVSNILHEFELDYRVEYQNAPTLFAPVAPQPDTDTGGRPRPPTGGFTIGGQPQQPDSSCIRI